MDLSKIFKGKSLKESDEIKYNYLQMLKDEATENQSTDDSQYELADALYDGNATKLSSLMSNYGYGKEIKTSNYLVNSKGTPLFGNINNFGQDLNDELEAPMRFINLAKNYVETFVAKFCEIAPKPYAVKSYDYTDNQEIDTVIKKVNLCIDNFFTKENNFNNVYEYTVRQAIKYPHTFLEVQIDKSKAMSQMPFKIKYINPKTIKIDPYASRIQEAEYVIQTIEMRFIDVMENFIWNEDVFGSLTTEQKRDNSLVTIEKYWIRLANKELLESKWLCLYIYNGKWLKKKKGVDIFDNAGAKIRTDYEAIIDKETYMYNILPIIEFRSYATDTWKGNGSLVLESVDTVLEYNETKNDEKQNFKLQVYPPTKGNIDAKKIKRNPKGHTQVSNMQQNYTYDQQVAVPTELLQYRAENIKQELNGIFGNVDVMEGSKPRGIYSNNLMESIKQINEIKPKRMERLFLESITTMTEVYLKLLAQWLNTGSIEIWDVESLQMITISSADIDNIFYKIKVEVKDINLMTSTAKTETLNKIFQYNPKLADTMSEYHKILLYNNAMPYLFPTEMVEYQKQIYEKKKQLTDKEWELKILQMDAQIKEIQMKIQQMGQPQPQGEQQQQQLAPEQQGQPIQTQEQQMEQGQQTQQMSDEELEMQIKNLKTILINVLGGENELINQIDSSVEYQRQQNIPNEEIFNLLKEQVQQIIAQNNQKGV